MYLWECGEARSEIGYVTHQLQGITIEIYRNTDIYSHAFLALDTNLIGSVH